MKNLNELTLLEALEGLKRREFSSIDLTKSCLSRIKKIDKKIKAFVTITEEEALKSAAEADEVIGKEGAIIFETKPLLGIPYACKDNFSTKGIKTTASSNVLKNYVPPFESTVTRKLKEAGTVLLGKTNMDAFAHGSSTETSDFFETRNPWDLKKVPGGSSGGSAVAVSSDMCIFATGSETAGSIRGPAAWCGVTGLKPTYGRVSRYGVIAMASSTDSPGPIAKTVNDAAYILNIIAGKDPLDATSSPKQVINYLLKSEEFNLKGIRIGKPKSYFEIELEEGVREKVDEATEKLKSLGAEIVDIDLISPKYSIAVYTILQRSEVSSNLARLDGIRYGNDRTNFGFEAKKRIMLGTYSLSAGYYDAFYEKAQKVRTLIINDFNEAFKNVDVLAAPTMPCVALNLGESDKSAMFGELMDVLTEPSSVAGLPGVSIPCGLSSGMPVGIQFIGNHFDESKIIGVSKVFQENTNFCKLKPKI
ncbi:Asp-tRNA(Asn)/Glu-tRNA(Gln) amidotransferase subunit GatA [candidate division WWE3 bacterium]|uniref:Glutamyl-tRNA(Gln) amidotransferase subunit A n=1 Tax=candidate division WWE3 bacterium TaxID=2053526 RepID=A0A7X9E7K2_UNCKA|nr:Asp-tRNA(Asn)/Glu-tRNA(Gln) amidotransferase subunit GatA [candidate division WWE3 bacterium]